MIEVISRSVLSIFVAIIIKIYLINHKIYSKITLSFSYYPYKYDSYTTYFIIKSQFLTSEQMSFYLQEIRNHSELANIIIIGKNIDYEELFKNHFRIFGVIDTTNNRSLTFIRAQVHFYLDGLYRKRLTKSLD
ncbi:hypothetical protein JOC31_000356 [Streptococcus saliviloxodontae]|uniref:Uncharacterized protein n=1 Tax=Streptococcus saliviloxodontae TaxID=1349416 RepID=A0ABS2PL81_9STRE|nr:hypothetical protein [Streptococcus saliviloxodontae]